MGTAELMFKLFIVRGRQAKCHICKISYEGNAEVLLANLKTYNCLVDQAPSADFIWIPPPFLNCTPQMFLWLDAAIVY